MVKLQQLRGSTQGMKEGVDLINKGLKGAADVATGIGNSLGAYNKADIDNRTQQVLSNINTSTDMGQFGASSAETLEAQYGTIDKGLIRNALDKLPQTVFGNLKAEQARATERQTQANTQASQVVSRMLAQGDFKGAKNYVASNSDSLTNSSTLMSSVSDKETAIRDAARTATKANTKASIDSFIRGAVNSNMSESALIKGITALVSGSDLSTEEGTLMLDTAKTYFKKVKGMTLKQKQHYDDSVAQIESDKETAISNASTAYKNYQERFPVTPLFANYQNMNSTAKIMTMVNEKAPDNAIFWTGDKDVNSSNALGLIKDSMYKTLALVNGTTEKEARAGKGSLKFGDIDMKAVAAAVDSMPYDSDDNEYDFTGLFNAIKQNIMLSLENKQKVIASQDQAYARDNAIKMAKDAYTKALSEARGEAKKIK